MHYWQTKPGFKFILLEFFTETNWSLKTCVDVYVTFLIFFSTHWSLRLLLEEAVFYTLLRSKQNCMMLSRMNEQTTCFNIPKDSAERIYLAVNFSREPEQAPAPLSISWFGHFSCVISLCSLFRFMERQSKIQEGFVHQKGKKEFVLVAKYWLCQD